MSVLEYFLKNHLAANKSHDRFDAAELAVACRFAGTPWPEEAIRQAMAALVKAGHAQEKDGGWVYAMPTPQQEGLLF